MRDEPRFQGPSDETLCPGKGALADFSPPPGQADRAHAVEPWPVDLRYVAYLGRADEALPGEQQHARPHFERELRRAKLHLVPTARAHHWPRGICGQERRGGDAASSAGQRLATICKYFAPLQVFGWQHDEFFRLPLCAPAEAGGLADPALEGN